MDFFIYSSFLISHILKSIPTAIETSKLGHVFLISAGARLTVILEVGSLKFDDFSALLSLSLLS